MLITEERTTGSPGTHNAHTGWVRSSLTPDCQPPERLVQTFEWDGMPAYVIINTTTFEALDGDRTRIVTTSQFHTTEERDGMLESGMEQGLNQSYAALDRLLAGVVSR